MVLRKDGDLVFLSDNEILVNKHVKLPTLMCAQRRAQKKIVSDSDLIEANINSFGSKIGAITNRVTSMYEVQSHFDEDSAEYRELSYRIKTGQKYQQDEIDKTKGIISEPMPREWYDRHIASKIEDPEKRELYLSILADKKPRFMIYIYPQFSKEYNDYMSSTSKKCAREFNIPIERLLEIPSDKRTPEQNSFITYYHRLMPVGVGDCVMNRICKKFEDRFDGYLKKRPINKSYDYRIMKSGVEYAARDYQAIKRLYDDYNRRVKDYTVFAVRERVDDDEVFSNMYAMQIEFRTSCDAICSNSSMLCDIILDICYKHGSPKRFVWSMCAKEIIENLMVKNDNTIHYPVQDDGGDIEFAGKKFAFVDKKVVSENDMQDLVLNIEEGDINVNS